MMELKRRVGGWGLGLFFAALASGWGSDPDRTAVAFRAARVPFPATGAISVIDATHLWVGLAHSDDAGRTWIAHVPDPTGSFGFIEVEPALQVTRFFDDRRGILGAYDAVWSTSDGGRTWRRILSGHLSGVWVSGRGPGWLAAGDDRLVQYHVTEDSGLHWMLCGSDERSAGAPLGSSSFVDRKHGWSTFARFSAQGLPTQEGVAATDDGGCHWQPIWWNPRGAEEPLGEIVFADARVGWLLPSSRAPVLRTLDGGITWTPTNAPVDGFLPEGGYLLDRDRGWVAGSSAHTPRTSSGMYYTNDGGNTWASVSKDDLEKDAGIAREVPFSWGFGYLMKLLARQR